MYLCVKINKKVQNKLEVAVKYYTILAALHNFDWTDFEIHLLAFILVKGNINAGGAKAAFIQWYPKKKEHLNNILSDMKKKGLTVRDKRKVTLNPVFLIDLQENLRLQLNISSEE